MTLLAVDPKGNVALPPKLRQKLGLKGRAGSFVVAESRDGGVFLQAAPTPKPRDFSVAQMRQWIAEDEAAMKRLKRVKPA
jgi:bifunctional DNA-binding transcriptional regulator/antitoxin component of YhaV-PrlF toxin-antitoxin module